MWIFKGPKQILGCPFPEYILQVPQFGESIAPSGEISQEPLNIGSGNGLLSDGTNPLAGPTNALDFQGPVP